MRDQSDQLAGLPVELDYIRNVVMSYTRAGRDSVKEWRASVDSLNPEQMGEIASVYRTLAERDDAEPLSAWIAGREPEVRERWNSWLHAGVDAELNGLPPPPDEPEPQQEPRALRLFELFDYLELRHITPFSSGTVKYIPPPVTLDWSKLPTDLGYLQQLAEEHGVLWGNDAWAEQAEVIQRSMPDLLGQLQAINTRLYGTPGEWQRIDDFTNKYPIDIHPEAARVSSLLKLIDHLYGRR